MAERKVINKYYPPDFDPSKIPRRRTTTQQQMKVRTMLPTSIRCATCGNYISRGTKFNSRKEEVVGDNYLGIRVYRFYFKCTNYSAEIMFKTDPKNLDYTFESGNFKHNWCRIQDEDDDKELMIMEKEKHKTVAELEKFDSLEIRTLKSKRQMDDDAALHELISYKSRLETVSTDAVLEALQQRSEEVKKEELEDEALIRSVFQGSNSRACVKRIHEAEEEEEEKDDDLAYDSSRTENNYFLKRRRSDYTRFTFKASSVKVSIVKKPPLDSNSKKIEEGNKSSNGLQWLGQQYESGED